MGRNWAKVADKPSGTGPWTLERLVPRERAELVRNPNYWDPARVPKSDRLILLAMPDASSRVAALLAGTVDWIEAPAPDSVPKLKSAGMQIVTNVYPHIWPYQLSYIGDSPMKDIRVRKALNLGDRDGSLSCSAAWRSGEGSGRAEFAVVRSRISTSPDPERAAHRGGLRAGPSAQDQVSDLDGRLRPDAAAADERVHPGEFARRRGRGHS